MLRWSSAPADMDEGWPRHWQNNLYLLHQFWAGITAWKIEDKPESRTWRWRYRHWVFCWLGVWYNIGSIFCLFDHQCAWSYLLSLFKTKNFKAFSAQPSTKVIASEFERSFRIIIGQFARGLRNKAHNKRERGIAYVGHTVAGYFSNFICKQYSKEINTSVN